MLARNLRRSSSATIEYTLSFVASNVASASTVTVPSETQAGDFIVFFDAVRNDSTIPTANTPSGYTQIINTTLNAATDFSSAISVKIADSGDAGSTLTGTTGTYPRKTVAVFRAPQAITAYSAQNLNGEGTTGTPSNQTKTGYTESDLPILIMAFYASGSVMDANAKMTVNGSTTMDTDIDSTDVRSRLSYLIYNDANIYNAVVSMSDYSAQTMQSFYVTFTF